MTVVANDVPGGVPPEFSGNQALRPLGAEVARPDSYVRESVLSEVADLQARGFDVEIVPSDTNDDPRIDGLRERVDKAIRHYSETGTVRELFRPEAHPVAASWHSLALRAIALYPFYKGRNVRALGDGIDPRAFDVPILGGQSARQIVTREKGASVANHRIDKYQRFIETPMEDPTEEPDVHGLKTAEYLSPEYGVLDARAVGSRARVARRMIQKYMDSIPHSDTDPVGFVSMGCGVAEPMLETAMELKNAGKNIGDVVAIDDDVLSLAVTHHIARSRYSELDVKVQRQNLVLDSPEGYLPKGGKNVCEAIGVQEYFRSEEDLANNPRFKALRLKPAENLIKDMTRAAGVDGYVIFGNMLHDRGQQEFFSQVWPRLMQRSITDTLRIIERAGIDPRTVQVRVPSEGLYALYGFKVPERLPKLQRSLWRKISGPLVARTFSYDSHLASQPKIEIPA